MSNADGSVTILVIEDQEDIRLAIQLFLESEGFLVRTAENGRDALEIVEKLGVPDLILLDMKMPVMNGWEFSKRFTERYGRSSPIVVMTAAADAESRAAEVHAEGWLGKPFDLSELEGKVRELVKRRT